MDIGSIENHRSREKGSLVYPVNSRRARGLSIGINLFPDRKICSFNCPYCEVFPFPHRAEFEIEKMGADLQLALATAREQNLVIKDICFSGNGEPSLSPHFPEALEKVYHIRNIIVPEAAVVLITNGSGLFKKDIFDLMVNKAQIGLNIWLKVDAGTEDWYKKMNQPQNCEYSLLINRIREFSALTPFIIQTMICKFNGMPPPNDEEEAWLKLITELSAPGKLQQVQIYGKARPGPKDLLSEALDPGYLEKRAGALRSLIPGIPVDVFP